MGAEEISILLFRTGILIGLIATGGIIGCGIFMLLNKGNRNQ